MDVHVLRANGVSNVAALGGTAVGSDLFEGLSEAGVERVTLALDNDDAGRDALRKAVDQAVPARRSPEVWVIDPDLLGEAKDPSELIQRRGRDAWSSASRAPVCAVTWRALDLTTPLDRADTPQTRRAGLAHAGAWLGTLPPRLAIEQTDALATIADSLGYDREATQRAFRARYWRPDQTRDASQRGTAIYR